jgi:DNA (cytosine-5)-methyltransferase 1
VVSAYYNDIDPFCCAVLRRHVASGELPSGVVDERDIRTVDAEELTKHAQIHLFAGIGGFPLGLRMAGWPDDKPILTAGFPCQPVSVSSKRLGQRDPRWLWPEVARVVRVVRPPLVLLENVTGLLARGMGDVLGDLAALGYDAEWQSIPAAAVGAPHIRERVWIVAYPTSVGRLTSNAEATIFGKGLLPIKGDWERWSLRDIRGRSGRIWRAPVSAFERVDYGLPGELDRLRALGNAVVPQVVEWIARTILDSADF